MPLGSSSPTSVGTQGVLVSVDFYCPFAPGKDPTQWSKLRSTFGLPQGPYVLGSLWWSDSPCLTTLKCNPFDPVTHLPTQPWWEGSSQLNFPLYFQPGQLIPFYLSPRLRTWGTEWVLELEWTPISELKSVFSALWRATLLQANNLVITGESWET